MKKSSAWAAVAGTVAIGLLAANHLASRWRGSRYLPAPIPKSPPAEPAPVLVGEPGEVVRIIEGDPYVANYPEITGIRPPIGSGVQLFQAYMVCNRQGQCAYSNAFNAKATAQIRQKALQEFVQRLKQSGWQQLDERTFRWGR